MNFQDCINILNQRAQCRDVECACCKKTQPVQKESSHPSSNSVNTANVVELSPNSLVRSYSELTIDQITTELLEIQQDRLKVSSLFCMIYA